MPAEIIRQEPEPTTLPPIKKLVLTPEEKCSFAGAGEGELTVYPATDNDRQIHAIIIDMEHDSAHLGIESVRALRDLCNQVLGET